MPAANDHISIMRTAHFISINYSTNQGCGCAGNVAGVCGRTKRSADAQKVQLRRERAQLCEAEMGLAAQGGPNMHRQLLALLQRKLDVIAQFRAQLSAAVDAGA